ncbi:MAG: cardiolipin synthase [Angelakisella sp.]
MKKLLRFLVSRVFWFSLLIILQIAVTAILLLNISSFSASINAAFKLLSLAVVVWLTTKNDNPSYKITWIILILTMPLLGGLFYLKFGNKSMPRRFREQIAAHHKEHPKLFAEESGDTDRLLQQYPQYGVQTDYIRQVSAFPAYGDTQVEYSPLGEDFFQKLQQELPHAEKFIFLEFFIIERGLMWDTVLEILKERAAAGVEICIIYDDFGCIQRLSAGYPRELAAHGIRAIPYNTLRPSMDPSLNYRDHRKLCVIDGKVGYCGGINLADEYINAVERFGHWKDTAVQLRGSAVRSLTRMFLQQWTLLAGPQALKRPEEEYLCSFPVTAQGFVQPYADTPLDSYNVAESAYLHLVQRSNRYVYITTPYLILDNEFVTSLKTAAESGVDVRIITPSHPDKWYVHMVSRSYYQTLIQSGVKIYEYQPGFIHAKMFLCDDQLAVVGTANLDYRSLYLHFENAVLLYHCPVIADIRRDFADTLEKSRLITLEELRSKLRGTKVLCALLKLLAPLM